MKRKRYTGALSSIPRLLTAGLPLLLLTAALQAQTADTRASAAVKDGEVASEPPAALKLPDLRELGLGVPRPVKAASAMLGIGRRRLALVLGNGMLGNRRVVDSAARDTQAVASALRDDGFVVMLREDLPARELRSTLKEFQQRLQPGDLGFIYATGLGAQIDGQNLLLPRDAELDASQSLPVRQAQLRAQGVPLAELVDALLGPAGSPRMLVVDAAFRHPALADLPAKGLAAQRLPPGMIALFGLGLDTVQDVPAVAALPQPAPGDPQHIAATPFARVLVGKLAVARIKSPDALRATRRALVEGSAGQFEPWIDGDTDDEELAEASLLDGLVPRTPEDLAREAARYALRSTSQPATGSLAGSTSSVATSASNIATNSAGGTAVSTASGSGEQSVSDVLDRARRPTSPAKLVGDEAQTLGNADNGPTMRPASARPGLADAPGVSPSSAVSALGSAASATGSVVGSAAGLASSVATAAVITSVAADAAVTAATAAAGTVVGATGSLAAQALSLGSRSGSASDTSAATAAAVKEAPPARTTSVSAAAPAVAPGAAVMASQGASAVPQSAVTASRSASAVRQGVAVVSPSGASELPVNAVLDATIGRAAGPASTVPAPPQGARPPSARRVDGRTVRNAAGGERPAYVPRSNSFGYAEGDIYTYQVIDTWKGEISRRYTTAIEEVRDDGQLLANDHQVQLDAEGRLVRQTYDDGRVSLFEPPQALWWAHPQRGESRDLRFTETIAGRDGRKLGEIEWKGSASVGRARKIELPAGEIEALPIDSSGWQYDYRSDGTRVDTKWSRTVWYSIRLGHPVAIDIEDTDHLGRLLRRERIELLHAQAVRATP